MLIFDLSLAPSLLLVYIFLSAFCSYLLLQALIPYLRLNLLDHPNSRSSHSHPTPRGGGISFVAISFLFSLLYFFCVQPFAYSSFLLVAAFPLALVGLIDDRYDLPRFWRFFVHLLTSAAILCVSPLFHSLNDIFTSNKGLLVILLISFLILITALINFINFMDGLDGLVAGCMVITISAVGVHLSAPPTIWVLVGSLAGFLFCNWSPSRVFMGDVGSTFLGAVFSGLVFQASTYLEAFSLLLLASPLLLDALLCVIRRFLIGQPIFRAHKLHLYQRLHQAGMSHSKVSTIFVGSTLFMVFVFSFGNFYMLCLASMVVFLYGCWLDRFVAVSFSSSL